ncbi:MAG: hypoxanthine phosphoribosyltransferase [Candidatus Sericytochromatia bacterium]|nr:hypoxanthine phosphoribosyltransferase [Candidatus Sericytochromatia bacterium]
MHDQIEQVLLSETQIAERVSALGAQISQDYAETPNLLLVGVLRGVAVFFGDMMRAISLPVDIDFMSISSYGASTRSSGVVRILKDLDENITGRHVLILEDIIDTGLTLSYLVRLLHERRPASLEICTLLDKPSRRLIEVPVRYAGFTIPDQFVVGYGLDYDQRFRNLPYVGVLKPEVYTKG